MGRITLLLIFRLLIKNKIKKSQVSRIKPHMYSTIKIEKVMGNVSLYQKFIPKYLPNISVFPLPWNSWFFLCLFFFFFFLKKMRIFNNLEAYNDATLIV
jgi:hypothetical protein